MRRAITVGFKHGDDKPLVLTGPEVPYQEQRADIKKGRASRSHPEFARVELWTNADAEYVRFRTPDAQKAVEAAEAEERKRVEQSRPKPKSKAKPKAS